MGRSGTKARGAEYRAGAEAHPEVFRERVAEGAARIVRHQSGRRSADDESLSD